VRFEFKFSGAGNEKAPRSLVRGFIKGSGDVWFRGVGSASGSLSVLIDLGFRKMREGVVGLLFLGERCFQELHGLI
jgi:hypothetical protein